MDLKKIKVETLPNGYALDVENNGYFYFNTNELLEGFMYHVGLEIENACSEETIQDMLVASMNWKENKKAVMEIKRLTDELEAASRKLNASEQREADLQKRINNMVGDLRETVKSKGATVTTLIAAMKSIATTSGRRVRNLQEEEDD